MIAKEILAYDQATWTKGFDDEGLAFFTELSFDAFLEDAMKGKNRALDSCDYMSAREQLTAIALGLA